MNEKWSQKYKRSIDCNNPKGFSQRAHCQGRKKNEMKIEEKLQLFLEKNCPTDPAKWSASKAAAKRKFDVYPSAYANGWAAKNYKSKGGGWKTCAKKESYDPAMGGWVQPSNKVAIENPFGDDDKLNEGGCWEGYKQVGMKEKNGKQVPNCVPINETKNMKNIKKEINEESFYSSQQLIQNLTPKIQKDIEVLKKQFPNYDIKLVKNRYENDGSYTLSISGKNTSTIDNNKLQKAIKSKIKEAGATVNDSIMKKLKKEEYPDHPERRDKDSEIDYGRVEPEEYDVDNHDDYKDFITFMREYTKTLNEADCGCVFEAEYQGRKVKLGKPMQGDVKKFKVYVKNDKGNVVKVNFGDPNMRIKKSNPERRKSFRARHNCDSPGPRWKARYWSCRKW